MVKGYGCWKVVVNHDAVFLRYVGRTLRDKTSLHAGGVAACSNMHPFESHLLEFGLFLLHERLITAVCRRRSRVVVIVRFRSLIYFIAVVVWVLPLQL